MSEAKLVAEVRTETGKGFARKARSAGQVPAVLYGWKTDPQTIVVDAPSIERFAASAGAGRLVQLQVGSEAHTVLLKDMQRDPLKGRVLHVDFHKVRLDQLVTTNVGVSLTGETERTNDGGIIAQVTHELQVSCLPTNIPEVIQVSTDGLVIGSTVTVADLDLPEGVSVLDDPELTIVTAVAPRQETEDEEEAAEEAEAEETAAEETSSEE